jgi:hypothetical protein
MKCSVEGCNNEGTNNHHITYDPEVKKPLCQSHHEEITAIYSNQGYWQRHPLSNKQRWKLWFLFVEGRKHASFTDANLKRWHGGRLPVFHKVVTG